MWYKRGHENPHFYPTIHPGRTAPDPGRIALVRCLHLAPLPDLAGFCPWGTRPKDCPPTRLRRPDRSQCDPWFQCWRSERAGRRLLTPPSTADHLLGRSSPATTGNLASSSAGVWQRERPVDLGTGRPGQFRARADYHVGFRRERPPRLQTPQDQLETRQALDHQPRSAVSTKKTARDRLIVWASQRPEWAIGFLDEVWWSRFAL